ncbi:MAG TPA: deoxyguanosinetriphosphate triphosphohydrolase [Oscillospiraceae bacterium]|nr:deoxyguanosinetriphosphate triphosphohydrolase [Oscillospiraceae bacterium]
MSASIRELTLKREENTLSKYAALCKNTKGRKIFETECPVRTAYQRDRDRILHSAAFRRLKDKTQVFLAPAGDHYRTRLTHTLEVSQIARTIARSLMLNEDLTEAIALGHDLGHTPFGHAGERALGDVCGDIGGFRHYEQSLRVVDVIEEGGKGLNLTYETRNGIANHTKGEYPETLEGKIVRLSDKIAYINHDIDDAVRGDIISESDIPKDIIHILGTKKSVRINTLVMSTIEHTKDVPEMEPKVQKAFSDLHKFMFENVYKNPKCKGEEYKAIHLVKKLYEYYKVNTKQMPAQYIKTAETEGKAVAARDFVAGMTDRFALNKYEYLFIPKTWEY